MTSIRHSTKLSSDDIFQMFSSKQVDDGWSFAEYKPSETGKWTHGYHRYPAKFIPQLVEKLVDEYIQDNNATINDPFMGCGTTIVTGISRGLFTSGTDINRIAFLITKAKATPIDPELLSKKIDSVLLKLSDLEEDQPSLFPKLKPIIPEKHIQRIDYWFSEGAKLELGLILGAIYEEDNQDIKDFLTVAFSHVLKSCSIWMQGSTKPTRDFHKKPTKPLVAFRRHLMKMQRGNNAFWKVVPQETKNDLARHLNIMRDDARKQPSESNSVDLVITSSPYVTSYEYADLHQLSTAWLDLADDLIEYRKEFIGTARKNHSEKDIKSVIGQKIVSQMSEKDIKMSKEIETYFVDMQEVFNESYRILRKGGRCCFVIGNTRLKGIDILNAEVFAESLQGSGFALDRIIKREIPSKILPQKRDDKSGRFASNDEANSEAYPTEYIVIGLKE